MIGTKPVADWLGGLPAGTSDEWVAAQRDRVREMECPWCHEVGAVPTFRHRPASLAAHLLLGQRWEVETTAHCVNRRCMRSRRV